MNNRIIQYIRPLLIGTIIAALYAFVWRDVPIMRSARDLFSSALNISAIIVGFLGTMKSVLLALPDTDRIKVLKAHGAYYGMISYLMFAITVSMSLAIVSTLCLIVESEKTYAWWIVSIWIVCAIATMITFYEVILDFSSLLKSKDS